MFALKIVITVLLFQIAFTQRLPPPPVEDDHCPEDQNNCSNNTYCYIYSETNQSYCAQSCDLNNGGCDTDRCVMVRVQCNTTNVPCPAAVNCHPSRSFNRSRSITPTRASRTVSRSRSVSRASRSSSGSYSSSVTATFILAYSSIVRPSTLGSFSHSFSRSVTRPTHSSDSVMPTRPSRSFSRSRPGPITATLMSRSRSVTTTASGSTFSILPSPSVTPGPYTCSLQPESGLCLAYFPSYFYNVTSRSCQMFVYGGCGGNDNRFSTSEECSRTCRGSNNICGLDPETGLCEAYIPSYFYNETSKKCEKFIYGGCGGNANRFSTQDHCQETCGIDVCALQPEAGNCRGSFPRYFYNKFTRKCELFVYGGCGGNGNRFSDVHNCEKTCVSSVPAISPTPVVSEQNIISVTVSSYDGDLDGLVADFTGDLMEVLTNNGIKDISIKIVNISYTPDNDVILTMAVYSDERVISGEKVAALINDNKETFNVAVSDAIVGDSTSGSGNSNDYNGLSRGAVAGIVIGVIVGLIFITLLVVVMLYFVMKRPGIVKHTQLAEKSDGMDNPIYSDNQVE